MDPTTIKPEPKAQVQMGLVRLRTIKRGAESLNLYCRCAGQTEWRLVGRAARATFDDTTPLAHANVPEVREYMAAGVIDDTQVGLQSDITTVMYAGELAA